MSKREEVIAGTEEPDAEVELNAQDLRELADPCDSVERASGPMKRPPEPLPKATTTTVAPAWAWRDMPASRPFLSLALAVGAISAVYLLNGAVLSSTHSILEPVPQSTWSASGPKMGDEPVLFANPFDAQEVFEFPAGTSEAEARDAVAQVLMERAEERQRQLAAQGSRGR